MSVSAHARADLLRIYDRAVSAVAGDNAVAAALAAAPARESCCVIAVGKAAQSMAQGVFRVLGDAVVDALLISKPGHLDRNWLSAHGFDGIEGGHPLPTEGSLEAGRRLLERLQATRAERLLFLISGGASSLVEVPVAGLGLDDLRRAGDWLLGSGLDIGSMNLVRKSLSRIKGGGLLRFLPDKPVRVLAISDVPGDDPGVIGSGLLVSDAQLAQRSARLDLPAWLRDWVDAGLAERGAPTARAPSVEIVAGLDRARRAAGLEAERLGYAVTVHDTFIDGDVAAVAAKLAGALVQAAAGVQVWGGEPTLALPAQPGRGGRNQHLALCVARELAGRTDCFFLSAGTDGTDGPTEDAGALVDGGSLERLAGEGLDSGDALRRADSGSALEAAGDLICTGPTGTNVMDLMIGLKLARKPV